jgi:hypothetical protein
MSWSISAASGLITSGRESEFKNPALAGEEVARKEEVAMRPRAAPVVCCVYVCMHVDVTIDDEQARNSQNG